MNELSNCAVITAIYRDRVYKSLPLDLAIHENIKTIMDISENGSNHLQSLKIPVSYTRFIVLSKAQLNETVLDIEIHPERKQSSNITSTLNL
jgi:hypothetical protein